PGPGPDRPEPAEKPSPPEGAAALEPPHPESGAPPPPLEARAEDLETSFALIEALVLESRFEEALRRLEEARRYRPDSAARIDAEIARVRAAEILFRARSDALALERQGDFEGAAAILRKVLETLPERYRIEARVAIEAIEGRRKALSPEGGETP
ncbi:MAG: tetratricopeptide repeat protein, partial [Planctomycetota bacterium]